jgi:ferredoxin-thioredoxin reductase catalytic subunit
MENEEIVCNCIYRNDEFKAPEQHRVSCPVYQHMLKEIAANKAKV